MAALMVLGLALWAGLGVLVVAAGRLAADCFGLGLVCVGFDEAWFGYDGFDACLCLGLARTNLRV